MAAQWPVQVVSCSVFLWFTDALGSFPGISAIALMPLKCFVDDFTIESNPVML